MTTSMPLDGKPIKTYHLKVNGKTYPNKTELRDVPVEVIKSESSYQRDTSENWVRDHRPYLPEQAGSVTLSLRAGNLYAVDGMHRINLARACDVSHVRAIVIHDLTTAEEATLFVRLQRDRRALTSWDLYKAELCAREPQTVELTNTINRAGFMISAKTGGDPRVVVAVDSLRYVFRLGGSPLLASVLATVTENMWLSLDRALSGPILKGLAIFLHSEQRRPTFDAEHATKTFRKSAPTFVLLKAQEIALMRRSASVSAGNVAEALLNLYNDRLGAAKKLPAITINDRKRPAAKGLKA